MQKSASQNTAGGCQSLLVYKEATANPFLFLNLTKAGEKRIYGEKWKEREVNNKYMM